MMHSLTYVLLVGAFDGRHLIDLRRDAFHVSTADGEAHASSEPHDEKRARARSFMPIFYLHFPKCGSSWAPVLGNFAVSDKRPKGGHQVGSPDAGGAVYLPLRNDAQENCTDRVPSSDDETTKINSACRNRFSDDVCFLRFQSNHEPLKCPELAPHVSAMFRDPVARVLSGYNHIDGNGYHHDCVTHENITMEEYARCVGNCSTNMLTGNQCGQWGKPRLDAAAEADRVNRAVALVEKLGFVGLTGEWPLSVCLFHAMYGGECLPESFVNSRKGKYIQAEELPDVGPALGSDLRVYQEARRVFDLRLKQYGVTMDLCRNKICAQSRDRFQNESETVDSYVYQED